MVEELRSKRTSFRQEGSEFLRQFVSVEKQLTSIRHCRVQINTANFLAKLISKLPGIYRSRFQFRYRHTHTAASKSQRQYGYELEFIDTLLIALHNGVCPRSLNPWKDYTLFIIDTNFSWRLSLSLALRCYSRQNFSRWRVGPMAKFCVIPILSILLFFHLSHHQLFIPVGLSPNLHQMSINHRWLSIGLGARTSR